MSTTTSFSGLSFDENHSEDLSVISKIRQQQQQKKCHSSGRRKSEEQSAKELRDKYNSSYSRQSARNFVLDSIDASKLRFSSLSLVGRDKELQVLQSCVDRCCGLFGGGDNDDGGGITSSTGATTAASPATTTREIVFVSGVTGSGKSALARSFLTSSKNRRLQWGWGKFDFFFRDEPLSGFLDAFQSLCQELTTNLHQTAFTEFTSALLDVYDKDELPVLFRMIPMLEEVITGEGDSHSDAPVTTDLTGDSEGNSQRMKYIVKKLCRVLTSQFAPVVIVLDDLQWSDQASRELLETLMHDNQNSKLMFIASYRSVDETFDVRNFCANLKKSSGSSSNVTEIEIGNLSKDDVNSVIGLLLSTDDDRDRTLELAELCYRRSLGNVFYLLQFLVTLKEESFLQFDIGSYSWKWDLRRIETETAATANLVSMVMTRLSKLPEHNLHFLQIVSCLGSAFHDRTIGPLWANLSMYQQTMNDVSKRPSLETMLELLKDGHFIEDTTEQKAHQWLHDSIQEAALATVAPNYVGDLKHRTGKMLLDKLAAEDLDKEIFAIANLLTTYKPTKEELDVNVDLFLGAAEKAIAIAAFQSASRYARSGIALLPADRWHSRALRLYSIGAEAAGFLGQVDEMMSCINIVVEHPGCTVMEKLHVYFVKIQHLQNNGEAAAALNLGIDLLRQLGCSFPKSKVMQGLKALMVMRRLRKSTPSPSKVNQLPMMTDEKKKAIVKIVFLLEACFYYTKEIFLYILGSATTVQLVLAYGLCDYSAGAFFGVGVGNASIIDDAKNLKRWCELGMLMTELVPNGHHESRACFATTLGFAWSQPMRNLTKTLLQGYKAGMKVGDTESAMWNCLYSIHFEFMSGKGLVMLEERCEQYALQMQDFRRHEALLLAVSIWRVISALIGTGDDSTLGASTLTSINSLSKPEELLSQVDHASSPLFSYFDRISQNMVLAYRRDYVEGAELSIRRGNEFLGNFPYQSIGMWDIFMRGFCLYAAAKKTGKRRYRRNAKKMRALVDKWLHQGDLNVRHHSALLEAEDLAIRRKLKEAQRSYESAIVSSSRGGYIQDRALAHERYALFLVDDLHDTENGLYHAREADRLYREWGAYSIATHITEWRRDIESKEGIKSE
mmetsp:Transcript_4387/g.10966  ORF Transcript_4387/g.10966 Transcript_4387/m.10966 type:complete len:1125 (-) Transcript_4387:332-3706(-)